MIVRQQVKRPYVPAFLAVALLVPAFPVLITNPSDALFAVLSGLAFWQIMEFAMSQRLQAISLASMFVGLGALVRSDGFVVMALISMLAVVFSFHSHKGALYLSRLLVAALIPFSVVVAGYVLFYYLTVGTLDLGLAERSYNAFEQGQGVVFMDGSSEVNIYMEGEVQSRALYGTPQQNDYSILKAVQRNPSAFLERVFRSASVLPRLLLDVFGKSIFYGRVFGLLIIGFSFLGFVVLARQKKYVLLVVMALWAASLLPYFVTFFRPGYFYLVYFVIFILVGNGVVGYAEGYVGNAKVRQATIYLLALSALVGFGLRIDTLAWSSIVLLLIASITYTLSSKRYEPERLTITAAALILIAVFLKAPFPSVPSLALWGERPDEQALLYMREYLPSTAKVAAYAPKVIWSASLQYVPLDNSYLDAVNMDGLKRRLSAAGVDFIYVDADFVKYEPEIWESLLTENMNERPVFESGDRSIQIFALDDSSEERK